MQHESQLKIASFGTGKPKTKAIPKTQDGDTKFSHWEGNPRPSNVSWWMRMGSCRRVCHSQLLCGLLLQPVNVVAAARTAVPKQGLEQLLRGVPELRVISLFYSGLPYQLACGEAVSSNFHLLILHWFLAGISSETILKPASVTEEELLDLIVKLNHDANVDGLLVQLPLPEHIDERKICNAVNPEKDVDGFHVVNVGRMCLDQYSMLPATPWGVWEIIKRTGIPTLGKNVVVAGRSKNVGMPIAMLLHTDGRHERPGGDATVTISHRYTPKEQLKQHTILADIVVAAAGIPNLITADMIKEGAAVIDVGINRIQDPVTAKPKLVGDVDFEGVKQKASYITPVPGGVGPMTVAMLMKNTIIAAKKMLRAQHLETFSA
uniref:methenyltetrahydrofolate cyclohydrolase n=1 Tax=Laticauda laticaudata TaxID=8630 RepID=A0A8C5WV65_LATLA